MSSGRIIPWIALQFTDQNGAPYSGGQLFSYAAGTSTPQATYTDQSLNTPNTNPVVLDSAGRASVFIGPGAFKFVLEDASGNVIWTRDNVVYPDNVPNVSLTSQVTGVLPEANGGTNQSGYTKGDTLYSSDANTLSKLSGNTTTTKKFLVQTGDGTNSAAPAWDVIQAADVPTLNQSTTGTAANVTGTVAIANGGTGQTSATAALNALLPSQTGNADKVLKTDGTSATWQDVTGAGGGGALQWIEDADAPTPAIDNLLRVYVFQSGLTQSLYAQVKVPSSYVAGKQITMVMPIYSNDTANTMRMQTTATLIRPGTDLASSTTNQRTSTNLAHSITQNTPINITFDITDTSGQINGVSVAADNYLIIQLFRGSDTSSLDISALVYGAEISFS